MSMPFMKIIILVLTVLFQLTPVHGVQDLLPSLSDPAEILVVGDEVIGNSIVLAAPLVKITGTSLTLVNVDIVCNTLILDAFEVLISQSSLTANTFLNITAFGSVPMILDATQVTQEATGVSIITSFSGIELTSNSSTVPTYSNITFEAFPVKSNIYMYSNKWRFCIYWKC